MFFNRIKIHYVWALLLTTMILNGWLLYEKYQLNENITTLKALKIHKYGQKALIDEPLKFKDSWNESNRIKIVAIFTDYGCTSCVDAEIQFLNYWIEQYPTTIQVYYSGSEKKYLEKFGAKFSYLEIDKPHKLFNESLIFGNPVLAVIDSNGMVLLLNTNDTTRPGSEQRRKIFFQKAKSIFESVY